MPKKQKKKKNEKKRKKRKKESPQFVMIPREINAVEICTQLLLIGHLKFVFSNRLRKSLGYTNCFKLQK